METRTYLKVTVTLLVYLACPYLVAGYATKNCTHDQLTSQVKQVAKFWDKPLTNYVDAMSMLYKEKQMRVDSTGGCPITQTFYEEILYSLKKLVETCFDTEMNILFLEGSSILSQDCNDQSLHTWWNSTVTKMMDVFKMSKITNPQYFGSVITFDKVCTQEEKRNSVYRLLLCFLENAGPLSSVFHEIVPNTQQPRSGSIKITCPEAFPLCTAVKRMLWSCFQADDCFSQQEMDLIRESVSTAYSMAMEMLSQISQNVGGRQTLIKVVDAFLLKNRNKNKFPDKHKAACGLYLFDLAIEDYQRGTCKTNIKQLSLSVASRQSSPKRINIAPIILSGIVIKSFNLSG